MQTQKTKKAISMVTALFVLLAMLMPISSFGAEKRSVSKTITKLELLTGPDDPTALIYDDGKVRYNLEGMTVQTTWSDGVTHESDCYGEGDGDDAWLDGFVTNIPENEGLYLECSVELHNPRNGEFDATFVCEQYDDASGELLGRVTVPFSLIGENVVGVKGIEVDKPTTQDMVAYTGIDALLCEGLKVHVLYTDGKKETVEYEFGSFGSIEGDPDAYMELQYDKIKDGQNEITVAYGRDDDYGFNIEHTDTFTVTGKTVNLPQSVKLVKGPDKEIYLGENGKFSYEDLFYGTQLEITYKNGVKETVTYDGCDGEIEELKYMPEGLVGGLENEYTEPQVGKNRLAITFYVEREWADYYESPLWEKRIEFDANVNKAKVVKDIEVHTLPSNPEPFAGLDERAYKEGMSVKLLYTDGTSEIVKYEDGWLEAPASLGYDYKFRIEVVPTENDEILVPGKNKISVIYTAETDEFGQAKEIIDKKETSFTINAKAYAEYDQALENNQNIDSQISYSGGVILNANHILWQNPTNLDLKFQKRTGIAKAYSRISLDINGNATFLDENGKVIGTRSNVKEIGHSAVLLKDGTLINAKTNKTITTGVEKWCELPSGVERGDGKGLIMKTNSSDVYLYDQESVQKVDELKNIKEIGLYGGTVLGMALDKSGVVYSIDYDEYSKTVYVDKETDGVTGLVGSYMLNKNGKVYDFLYNPWDLQNPIADFIPMAYKSVSYQVMYDEETGDFDLLDGYLMVDSAKNVYLMTMDWDDNGDAYWKKKTLAGKFEHFTNYGYQAQDGTYYDVLGNVTDILATNSSYAFSDTEFVLKTDGTLYYYNQKLLTNVTNFESYYPTIITRKDGSVWLFDEGEPEEDRQRISPPQKLTEELVEKIYGSEVNKPIDISTLSITVANQNYDGTSKKPVPVVKDGDKTLEPGLDYTVSYRNNTSVGTAEAIITGIGQYTGTVTKTFQIIRAPEVKPTTPVAKASQTITAKSFTKTYGNKPFSLGARAKTKLTYKSSDTKVVTVSNNGQVTLKGPGKATITITAAATNNYNAATKKITITVKPKQTAGLKVKKGKKRMTVSWKRDKKATGYQITYAQNKKFKKGKKNITISKNKTVKRTVKKLKARKTYYVKVRAYKKVGKTKLYGAYSKVKKVKVR